MTEERFNRTGFLTEGSDRVMKRALENRSLEEVHDASRFQFYVRAFDHSRGDATGLDLCLEDE
jgi:hypothetical protein